MDPELPDAAPLFAVPPADHDGSDQPIHSFVHMKGIRSGEICVRILGETLCATDGAVHGLAPAIHMLALAQPTLPQTMAPWVRKLEPLRQRRLHIQEKRLLARKRYDASRLAMDALVRDPECLLSEAQSRYQGNAAAAALHQYTTVSNNLTQQYSQHVMTGVLQYYPLLEEERAWISAWQQKEIAVCHALSHATRRRHHLDSFAVHVESETLGQVRLWRLPDGDPQRVRCVKAASENIKSGFFTDSDSARIEVSEVYKMENQPLLHAFEQSVAHVGKDTKVKGLFCSVPTECLERCVVWGMFGDEAAIAASSGLTDQRLFNRPSMTAASGEEEAPGTQRRFVASQRVQQATAMQFPRRFSRYSTLSELQMMAASDLKMATGNPIRYLALCRVAMGKTQRATTSREFPANASISSLLFGDEDEYAIRFPEAVVPEFLIEYRFLQSKPVNYVDATSADRILPVRLSSRHCEPFPSASFETSVKQLLDEVRRNRSTLRPPSMSLIPETTRLPPVFSSNAPFIKSRTKNGYDEEELSTEKALEMCGRQRRMAAANLEQMRRVLWEATKAAWDTIDLSARCTMPKKKEQKEETELSMKARQACERKEMLPLTAKKQSFTAKKLYGELALERQIQANDVARLDALARNKLNASNQLKKKDGAGTTKPRPFR